MQFMHDLHEILSVAVYDNHRWSPYWNAASAELYVTVRGVRFRLDVHIDDKEVPE